MIKKILQHRVFIAVAFFILGLWTHHQIQNVMMRFGFMPQIAGGWKHQLPIIDQMMNQEDPFSQMQKMQEQMLHQFGQGNQFQIQANELGEMNQREDADNIYLEINLNGLKPKTMNVEVVDHNIVIQGQLESKNNDGNSSTYFSSSFHRSFPMPEGVDAQKFKMNQENDKIVIQFPKRK